MMLQWTSTYTTGEVGGGGGGGGWAAACGSSASGRWNWLIPRFIQSVLRPLARFSS
jgi:hypothetical protein